MNILTTILILGIAALGIAGAAIILTGPIYAWNGDPPRSGELSKAAGRANALARSHPQNNY